MQHPSTRGKNFCHYFKTNGKTHVDLRMDRLTSELLNALFWFQSRRVSAGKSVSGISHLRSDQAEIMDFQVLDYEHFSSRLRKILLEASEKPSCQGYFVLVKG